MHPSMETWYYMKDGNETGPVTTAVLAQLLGRGTLTVDTLVWREGAVGWKAIRDTAIVHKISNPSRDR